MAQVRLLLKLHFLLMYYCVSSAKKEDWIDGNRMRDVFSDLADKSVGRNRFKDHLKKYVFDTTKLNGSMLLDDLASKMQERMENTFIAVKKLAQEVERGYHGNLYQKGIPNDPKECCNMDPNDFVYDIDFLRETNTTRTCTEVSADTTVTESLIPDSPGLFQIMSDNKLKESSIKWQYFGTEDGIFVNFPALFSKECSKFDPRYRPWYAEAATSRPKDIVIVFDRSGSVSKNNLMSLVQVATKTVIDTLNADDRVGLVAFNDKASRPPGIDGNTCYNNHLAAATPDNKEYLRWWIDSVTSYGTSAFKPALTDAFDFLEFAPNVATDPRPRYSVIIFLSDGEETYGRGEASSLEILNLIRDRNARLSNKVIITTYEIVNDDSASTGLLKNISQQTRADLSKGPITPGDYVRITSTKELRSKIGSYYNTLAEPEDISRRQPVQSTPYVDFYGLGLIMTICLPVHINGKLMGVAGIDISLTQMASEIVTLHHSNNAYGFITDYKSRTIVHPLMPDALNYNKLVYLDITDLERTTDVASIIENMKNGTSGRKVITTELIKSRGNTTTDGIVTRKIQATYTWKPVGNLSLAIVTTDEDVTLDVTSDQGVISSESFTYHRLDFSNVVRKCEYFGRMSTTEHTVVKLTQGALVAGQLFNYLILNNEMVENFRVYLNDGSTENNHKTISRIAKKMISISEGLEEIWKSLTEYEDAVVWRYFGSIHGHARIYPGLALPEAYDMTKRPFFSKTIHSKEDIIIVTPPYLDAFGAGIVASVCMPVFLPGRQDNHILGILGLDFKMAYLEAIVKSEFKACSTIENRCFIMDNSGYLVYHSNIVYNEEDDEKEYDGYHITEKEPDISRYLMQNGYMVQKDCIDFGYKKNLFTWRIKVDTSIEAYDSSPYFDMVPVSGTNLYLGIKKITLDTKCNCPQRNTPSYGIEFFYCRTKSTECSCPCVTNSTYDYCWNKFQLGVDGSPTCYPQPPSIGFQSPIPNEPEKVRKLSRCFPDKCNQNLNSESSCGLLKECKWCPNVKQCVDQNKVCLTDETEIPIQIAGIIGGCVAGFVLMIIVIVAVVSVKWQKGQVTCCGARKPQPGVYEAEESELSRRPSDVQFAENNGMIWSDPGNGGTVQITPVAPAPPAHQCDVRYRL